MKLTAPIPDWLRKWVDNPGGELTRWQRTVRWSIDLGWHCAKALKHDKATEMAAALTYRTIFSLIPLLVISLVVFSAMPAFKEVRVEAQGKALDYLGIASITATEQAPDQPADPIVIVDGKPATPAEKEQQEQIVVADKISELIDKVENMNFASLGVIGFLLLVWAALALVIAMEYSFNQIYNVAAGRSFTQRITLYWTTLTLGPVLVFASVYVANRLMGYVRGWEGEWAFIGSIIEFSGRFTAVGASWLLLMFLYTRMPNAVVRLRAAAVGALVAAILWEFGKYGFGLYVRKALPYSALYGSLALIPLFLYWVYLTWLIILFGLELTYTLQNMQGRRFKHDERKAEDHIIDPAWAVPLISHIARAFKEGAVCNPDEISREMNLPQRAVTRMVAAMEESGLVHKVATGEDETGITLARPAEQITVAQVVQAAQSLMPDTRAARNGDPAWKLIKSMTDDSREKLNKTTLAELVG